MNNEYCNTWSSKATSFYDESQGPVEISWGTHELTLPYSYNKKVSNEYQLIIDEIGCDKYGITYSPISKNTVGMMIRHEECFTICRKLAVKINDTIIYKPTSFYIYHPSDSTMMSIHELKERNFIYQDNMRLLTSEIIDGRDELGVTLFFADGTIYWIGSLLDIDEARYIYDNQYNDVINCTCLQVIAGYWGSFIHIINNINNKTYNGLIYPEDMPIRDFMKWTKPLLGTFYIIQVKDWNPKDAKYNRKYIHGEQPEENNNKPLWQFSDFVL
jgi:homospermidine synthase